MKYPDWLPEKYRPYGPEQATRRPTIERLIRPFAHFMQVEASAGLVLVSSTILALVLANSVYSDWFADLWQTKVSLTIGTFSLSKSLLIWINDGLMAIFFFVVGLEIKREMVYGELQDIRKAALPAMAALGGMVVPAAIYIALQHGQPGERGWGVPMATDIAFVVGFLALLGSRVPFSLKILLLTLAIVDDIGAVLVIAVAYTTNISAIYLILAGIGFGIVALCNRLGVRPIPVYVVLGAGIWLAFLKSGVHPTVAGVILGLMTPARPWFAEQSLLNVAEGVAQRLRLDQETSGDDASHHEQAVRVLMATARETVSPLDRLEHALHPWVAFGIMPIFALSNAGVRIDLNELGNPIAIAVALGLIVGKPVGIVAFSWIAVKLGIARLPNDVGWGSLIGAACLAGIGFTMSLFVAGLALDASLLNAGKVGTLLGSMVSAILGMSLLLMVLSRSGTTTPAPRAELTKA